jgi:two-component sensor histidine kinase
MLITGRPVKDAAGAITGGVVALVDMDEEHRAKQALAEALRAKSTLLYEVNHRVKNSLQMLTGSMLVEASKIKDEAAKQAFLTVRSKVSSIAQLHHRLYGDGAHNAVDFGLFLKDVAEEFVQSLGTSKVLRIDTSAVFPGSLLLDVAAPLAMLRWELLTNCFKHAYEQDGLVHVRFDVSGDQAVLEVADEGAGLPEGFLMLASRL